MNFPSLDEAGAVHTVSSPEAVLAALTQGKHVLCDPPLGCTTEDCDAILRAIQPQGPILMAGHTLRFRPEYRYLRELVRSQELGRIQSATFIRQASRPSASPVNSLLHLLIDDIDQALLLFGVPAQVNCKAFAGPETAMATLVYPGGPEVRIQGGWFPMAIAAAESFQLRADSAELNFSRDGLILNDSIGQRRSITLPAAKADVEMLAYFLDCCRSQQQPSLCPPTSSALAVRVALLLKQSREMGGQPLECKV